MAAAARQLRDAGQRLLVVDTSGAAAFAPARRIYAARGYDEEARLRDFWAAGDDKVTFRKALQRPGFRPSPDGARFRSIQGII